MADTRRKLEEQLIDDKKALEVRRKLKNTQILDFSGNSKSNWFESDDLTRLLNDAQPTQEISALFTSLCNQIIDALLSASRSKWQDENLSMTITMKKEEAIKTQDISEKLSDFSCITIDKNGDMVLVDWLEKVLPPKSHKPILDMIKLQIEASFAAVFKSNGELNDELTHFLKRPPFSDNDLKTTIENRGKPTVYTALMQAASVFLIDQFLNEQSVLAVQEMSSGQKISHREITRGAISSSDERMKAFELISKIFNNIVATAMPAYIEARFNALKKPADEKTIASIKSKYTKVKKDLEKIILAELKKFNLNTLLNDIDELIESTKSHPKMSLLTQAAKNLQILNELNLNIDNTLNAGSTNFEVQQFADNLHEFQSFLTIYSIHNDCTTYQNHLENIIAKELTNVLKIIQKDLATLTDDPQQKTHLKERTRQYNKLQAALSDHNIEQMISLCNEHKSIEEDINRIEIKVKELKSVDEQSKLQLEFAQQIKNNRSPQFIQNKELMQAVEDLNAVNSLMKSFKNSDMSYSKQVSNFRTTFIQPDIQETFSNSAYSKKFVRAMQTTLNIPEQNILAKPTQGTSKLWCSQNKITVEETKNPEVIGRKIIK